MHRVLVCIMCWYASCFVTHRVLVCICVGMHRVLVCIMCWYASCFVTHHVLVCIVCWYASCVVCIMCWYASCVGMHRVLVCIVCWRRVQTVNHVMKQFMANTDSFLISITVQLQLCRFLHTNKTRNFSYCWNRN